MLNKLKMKFVAVNMIIVTIMLAVIFGLVLFFTESNLEKESIQLLRSVPVRPFMPGQHDIVHESFNPLVFTLSLHPDGKLRASGSNIIDLTDEKLVLEIYEAALVSGNQTGILEEYNLRFFIQNNPMIKSVAFTDITAAKSVMSQLVRTCIFISIISFAVFFVISLILAQWTVKPVETAWNEQKQFVADASHELKTPLTVIITNAEMLTESDPPQEKRLQFAESILAMSRQMRELTESLLELARNDNHTSAAVFEKIDISQLVSESVLPFEPLYFEKGLTLNCEIENNIEIIGDHTHLSRLADILLDNAMKYSYSQSEVSVDLKKQGNWCILSVTSHGDTISRNDLKNIFRRFYRIDKARSMNHSYGLGLAIAESIAREHGGKIWAESADNVNKFYVKLPVK